MFAKILTRAAVAGLLALLVAVPARAEEPLVEKVKTSIDRGVRYLKQQENGTGNWESVGLSHAIQPGGWTCLAMLALLNSGVKHDDPVIKRGLEYLRKLGPANTYVVGLQTMVFAEAGDKRDLQRIQTNVDWLIRKRVTRGGRLQGWGYGNEGGGADNSNTQYALLGLHAGKTAGANIPEDVWKEIQDFYLRTQAVQPDGSGGWRYHADQGNMPATLTMTVAGVCGLYISGLELNANKQELDPKTGVARNCGKYAENEAIVRGLKWVDRHFRLDLNYHTFYNVYGIERLGRLSGQRFIGDHDWYREGCRLLVGEEKSPLNQQSDGSWVIANRGTDGWPVVSTSFALLFLSKGRTPILVSKLAWDAPQDRLATGLDWNRKHHDARHLAVYASRELFKKQPMAWQIYDPRRLELPDEAAVNDELSSLLQSPILYMNGHKKPVLTPRQKKLLKRYLEEGGFLVAEACCGSKEFADGFRELMADRELFPDSPLQPVPPDHPIWRSHALVPPAEFPKLEYIEVGCKTVVIFSPEPLAGYWEEERFAPKAGVPAQDRGQQAYRLAGNIIAYATGMEPPKPRLTQVKIADTKDDRKAPRSALKIAQVRHDGDWHPAPQAMRNLASHLRDRYKLDITLQKEEVPMGNASLSEYKVMYMHGRKRFTFDPEEVANVKLNLETGGLLLADACCGKKEFDAAFREFAAKLYPDKKLERIPLDDYLFSAKLNGTAVGKVRCRTEAAADKPDAGFETVDPLLEGIKVDGRWVVIYSRYDLGCALEGHKSSACLGHDKESALKLASAAVLYALKR